MVKDLILSGHLYKGCFEVPEGTFTGNTDITGHRVTLNEADANGNWANEPASTIITDHLMFLGQAIPTATDTRCYTF